MRKTVLVIGGGGRESVLVHKYSQSPQVKKVVAIPGNDLMQINSKIPVKIYPKIKVTDVKNIISICKKEKVDLVDIAIDAAVEAGVTDEVEKLGILAAGPSKIAGQIEWDKAWAREFMLKYKISHPRFNVFLSQKEGIIYIKNQKEGKWFIKANGLVDGKGALPAKSKGEAIERIKEMSKFGKMGEKYLIEDWLEGEEFSAFALCDGNTYKIIGYAQDHKRMFNFDEGENTGGMGCCSPSLLITPEIEKQSEKIIKQTIEGLTQEKRPFKGVLYLGGIVVKDKVYVIEYNARWGDPEAEVILPAIKTDFYKMSETIAKGKLKNLKIKIDRKYRVSIAITLRANKKSGLQVFGIDKAIKVQDVTIYNSRVQKRKGKYWAQTGRQLHIVGEGKNIMDARQRAYEAASLIFIEGNNQHYRTDIGWRDLERKYKIK